MSTTVSVESLAYGGDGIAHLPDGRVVFVRGACPGDVVELASIVDHGRWAKAGISAILEPSPHRIDAPCPYAGTCGGCQWQHVAYEAQLEAKRRIVVDAFERIAHLTTPEVDPVVTSPATLGYRNKVELVPGEAQGRIALGYHRLGTEDVVPVDRCLLMPRRVDTAPRALTGALRYLTGRHGDLGIKRVGVRTAANRKDLEIALWTSTGSFPRKAVASTLADAVKATGVTRVLLRDDSARRAVAGVEVLSGKGFWRERLAGFDFAISAPSFFQVNTTVAEKMVALVIEALSPGPDDRVADVYSGAGTFTLPLAQRADEVVAFEGSSEALADLRRNLANAGLDADIVGGDAERELPSAGPFDLAVVDPPRQGLSPEAINALVDAGPRRIAYVSCDPSTLARDSRTLVDRGYRVARVTPVDLFPQTYHVETVAIFEQD